MHLVDTTMFFCPRGGGVKRYLLAKHAWLNATSRTVRHSLLVPAVQEADSTIKSCKALSLPLNDGYRFPLRLAPWRDALIALRPDLIEAGDPYLPAWATRAAAKKLGIPIVAFFHSDLPRMLEQRVRPWIKPVARSYLRTLYGGFDLVLAPSHAMLDQLENWGIRRTALQPLGVDTNVFSPTARRGDLRRQLGLPPKTRLLIYAGRFAREKNLERLVEAVASLGRSYHLLMVGGERRRSLTPTATVLPYVGDEAQLAQLLASCDAFVHAGDQETFGLVVIEAMACGLPVVAVARGGVQELVDECVGMAVAAPHASQLSAAIAALFERDLSALGKTARSKVLHAHSWDTAFHQLLRHYGKLCGESISTKPLRAHAEA